ncbi:MAG: hypothetical protein RSC04_02065 [Bacteroidales bacterium]
MSKKNLLTTYLNFDKFSKESLIDLKEMVDSYPYCQVGQMLFLLNLKKIADPNFDNQLSYTAIAVPDRQLLKQHIASIDEINSKPQLNLSKKRIKETLVKQKDELNQPEKQAQWDRFARLGTITISNLLFDEVEIDPISLPTEDAKRIAVPEDSPLPQKSIDARPVKSQALEAAKTRLKEIEEDLPHIATTQLLSPTNVASKNQSCSKAKSNAKPATTKKAGAAKSKLKNHELSQEELIERFLTKPDHILITPDNKKKYFDDADINQSLKDDFENGSETLAKLYITQGAIDKAIEIYKHLSLKYPEKSRFFAKEIREAKKKIIK